MFFGANDIEVLVCTEFGFYPELTPIINQSTVQTGIYPLSKNLKKVLQVEMSATLIHPAETSSCAEKLQGNQVQSNTNYQIDFFMGNSKVPSGGPIENFPSQLFIFLH